MAIKRQGTLTWKGTKVDRINIDVNSIPEGLIFFEEDTPDIYTLNKDNIDTPPYWALTPIVTSILEDEVVTLKEGKFIGTKVTKGLDQLEGNVDSFGWRLIGRDNNLFGKIGNEAIDISTYNENKLLSGATGASSFAIGIGTYSIGTSSFAGGYGSKASGSNSIALGFETESTLSNSTSLGLRTKALNTEALAIGRYNKGLNNSLFEVGIGTTDLLRNNAIEIFDDGTIVAPELTIDKINQVVALPNVIKDKILTTREFVLNQITTNASTGLERTEGDTGEFGLTIIGRDEANYGPIGDHAVDLSYNDSASSTRGATGTYAHTEGHRTTASGNLGSHSEGHGAISSGDYGSHAEGYYTIASGYYGSHAEGFYTTTPGGYGAHSEGMRSVAEGNASHAEGIGTISKNEGTHAEGTYNIGTYINTIHETGIGTTYIFRKNGFEIFNDGTIVAPEMTIDMINQVVPTTNVIKDKILTTREFVLSRTTGLEAIDEGNGIGWRLNGQDTNHGPIGVSSIDLSVLHSSIFFPIGAIGDASIAIGVDATASENSGIAIGYNSRTDVNAGIALGGFATLRDTAYEGSINIGSMQNKAGFVNVDRPMPSDLYHWIVNMGIGRSGARHRTVAIGSHDVNSGYADSSVLIGEFKSGYLKDILNSNIIGNDIAALNSIHDVNVLGNGLDIGYSDSIILGSFNTNINAKFILSDGVDDANRNNYFYIDNNSIPIAKDSILSNIDLAGDKALITREYLVNQITTSASTGLERTEGATGEFGLTITGRDEANYGPIGDQAVDLSYNNTTSTTKGATGKYSYAEGYYSIASGDYGSHVEGYNSTASGDNSHAEGNSSTASGDFGSHAEGYNSTSSGDFGSHAEGYNTISSGEYGAHAEGYNTISSGEYGAHAEGNSSTASGDFGSHAEGYNSTASGYGSHAEGYYKPEGYGSSESSASGSGSHIEGYVQYATSYDTIGSIRATGHGSHAEGAVFEPGDLGIIAVGKGSHAEGIGTTALNNGSHAEGRHNIGTYTNTIHETGIGKMVTDDYSSTGVREPKNGFEIFEDGTIVAPELTIDMINQVVALPNVIKDKILVTREFVLSITDNISIITTVADEAALLAVKTAGNMHVYDKYIITQDRDGTANVDIQIKFKSPDNNFFYEKIDNNGVIELIKVI